MWPFKRKPVGRIEDIPLPVPPPPRNVLKHVASRYTCTAQQVSPTSEAQSYFVFEADNEETARAQFNSLPAPNPGFRYVVRRVNTYVSADPQTLDW